MCLPDVRAEQVDPPSISLRWEDEVRSRDPRASGDHRAAGAGLRGQGAPKVEPAMVKAMGPRSVVDVVQFARAEAFDVTGIAKEGSEDRSPPARSPPARVEYATPTVKVRIEIGHEELRRDFAKVPVQVVGVARGVVVPAEVTFASRVRPDIVRSLRRRSGGSHDRSSFCRSEHFAAGLGQAPGDGRARRVPRDGAAADRRGSLVIATLERLGRQDHDVHAPAGVLVERAESRFETFGDVPAAKRRDDIVETLAAKRIGSRAVNFAQLGLARLEHRRDHAIEVEARARLALNERLELPGIEPFGGCGVGQSFVPTDALLEHTESRGCRAL